VIKSRPLILFGILRLARLAVSQVAVTTLHYDSARTGVNIHEAVLPANLNSGSQHYASLNTPFPNWDAFQFNDSFPWVIVGYAATVNGRCHLRESVPDLGRQKVRRCDSSIPVSLAGAEDDWFMRMLALQEKTGRVSVKLDRL